MSESLIDVDGAEYSIRRPARRQWLANETRPHHTDWMADLCPSIDWNYTGLAGSPVSCVGTVGEVMLDQGEW
jgi:hypothetical protein